jgi:transposase
MPQERLSMRKISEILRLKHVHKLSNRKISKACNVSKTTVARYLAKAAEARISWPLPPELDESRLQALLFPSTEITNDRSTLVPDWNTVHKELQKKHVTKFLLWEEYKQSKPDGFEYSWFCREYNTWRGKLDLVMRHTHRAGEKLFIDYAGHTMSITHPGTGEIKEAQIFIAVLGASNYTYAEATWTQSLQDWINSHIRTFKYIQGVPLIVVPDNLKSGVHKSHIYEPNLNPTYQDMALHYNIAIIPARKRKPKDKAKAENAVLLVSRWILARIRNQTFFSIHDLNQTIRRLLETLNNKPFKKLEGSRKHLFEELDRPALQPLPEVHYEYALWKKVRVNIDYHVEVEKHYYSVPYQLVKRQLDAKYTENIVEIFHKNTRVASHKRSLQKGRYSTLKEHMPKSHQEYAAWTPERLLNWAAKSGPSTARLVENIMAKKIHPQQGFRACLGIMRLGKTYGFDRLELACQRALSLGSTTYKSVESILKNNLDKKTLSDIEQDSPKIEHGNIRGSNYYN